MAMKAYEPGSDEAKTKKVLDEISDDMDLEDDATRRARLKRELVEEMHAGVTADPDRVCVLIEDELVSNRTQYPSLLDIHDGNVERLAIKVRDMMIAGARNGWTQTMRQVMGHMEGLAARAKLRVALSQQHIFARSRPITPSSGSID